MKSVEMFGHDGIHKIHRAPRPRRNHVAVGHSEPRQSPRVSYLDLPPGTVFIGQEPTTVASPETIAQRIAEQPGVLWELQVSHHRVQTRWLRLANSMPKEVDAPEPLQKTA